MLSLVHSSFPSEQQSYNIDLLKRSVAYNSASLREIIGIFIQQKPQEMMRLQEAISEKNLTLTTRLAHSLKGNLTLFGMTEAYEHLIWIERYAKENMEWTNELDQRWRVVRLSFERVLQEIPQELILSSITGEDHP